MTRALQDDRCDAGKDSGERRGEKQRIKEDGQPAEPGIHGWAWSVIRDREIWEFIVQHVGGTPEEVAAADLLNRNMQDIRDRGKVVGLDRVAVMAALNLANEVIKFRSRDESLNNTVGSRIESLRDKLDTALGNSKQLSL